MQTPDDLGIATSPDIAATFDALWAAEAEDRLAAYQRGVIASIPLVEVLEKHRSIRRLELWICYVFSSCLRKLYER